MKVPIFDWIMDAIDESRREKEALAWAAYSRAVRETKERRETKKSGMK